MDVIGVGSSGFDSAKRSGPKRSRRQRLRKSDYLAMSKTDPPPPGWRMCAQVLLADARSPLTRNTRTPWPLPPGSEVVSDLCAARLQTARRGVIQIEPKDAIKERIGRSPDVGGALMMAWMPPSGSQTFMVNL